MITSAVVVATITVSLLIVYLNQKNGAAAPPPTTPPALTIAGSARSGQSIQVTGSHFTPGMTVVITIDGQPIANSTQPAAEHTTTTLTLNIAQAFLPQSAQAGTRLTVRGDGTFTISIHIASQWNVGSTHQVEVEDANGHTLRSLNFTVQSDGVTQTATATPTTAPPTATPTTVPTTPTPTSQPTPTSVPPTPTATPVPPTSTPAPVQRQLSNQQTQSQMVDATGSGQTAATHATGFLTFHSVDTYASPAGTTFSTGEGGVTVIQDQDVNISQTYGGTVTVAAHVFETGTVGNIPANAILTTIRSPGGNVTVSNDSSFTGGQDAQTYTAVQQSDIDGAAGPLKTATTQSATANIQRQLQANEHLVGNPQCSSNVSANHAAGDEARVVTVTVTTTCTATAST